MKLIVHLDRVMTKQHRVMILTNYMKLAEICMQQGIKMT
jgi:hypothetical protein